MSELAIRVRENKPRRRRALLRAFNGAGLGVVLGGVIGAVLGASCAVLVFGSGPTANYL